MGTPSPDDLIMIEPFLKSPLARSKQEEKDRIYFWIHKGERVRINEIILRQRVDKFKLVCDTDMIITRVYNTHSIVINTATGEVFDGSAAVA
jgi:hypothetical protein